MMTFEKGDYLIFQIESGYGLLRVLDVQKNDDSELIWHILAYDDLFLDVEFADMAVTNNTELKVSIAHTAMTNRAFLSTQVSKLDNKPLKDNDLHGYISWQQNPNREVSDRSIRLMLGLR
jgi:hypothetical protein